MKLLIADDYPSNRKLLRVQLEVEGHTVIEVANGIEAMQILRNEPVDAVISDILMPNMDGFRLCQEIRRDPKLYALPLILFTSTYNSPSDRKLAATVGADCYLQKPSPTPLLMASLLEAQQKSVQREPPTAPLMDDKYVLQQYNDTLVRKLEDRNNELQSAIGYLEIAREEILQWNKSLELRVKQRTAELDAANEELEAFSASVSHDLRAPLRNLSGFAHLLEDTASDQLNAEGKDMIKRIRESAKHMDELITGLLEFAHAGRGELHWSNVDLDALVDESIRGLQLDCQGRHVEWHRKPLPVVQGDPTLLRQVLVNLVSNAVKYTRHCDPAHIEIGCRDEGNEDLVVYVRDNGIGFDMESAANLFGVFRRLHNADEFEGTGIGLANARRIVTRHGGRIWAEAEIGHGATFYFTVHKARDPSGMSAAQTANV